MLALSRTVVVREVKPLRRCAACLERGGAPGGPEADRGLMGRGVHCHWEAAGGAQHTSGGAALARHWVHLLKSPAGEICAQHSILSSGNLPIVPMSIFGKVVADVTCGADCLADHADGDAGAHPAVPGTCRLCGALMSQSVKSLG